MKKLLDDVHSTTAIFLCSLDDVDLGQAIDTPWGARYPLYDMRTHLIEHEIHHRAELSLILGMLGRVGFDA